MLDSSFARRVFSVAALGAVVALALFAAPAVRAQAPGADALLRDFQPADDYVLEIDGKTADTAEVLYAERVPAYLLMSSKIPPTLVLPRSGTIETVSVMKLARRANGFVDLLADAELVPVGRFTMEKGGELIRFAVGERQVRMVTKPYLLGAQTAAKMLDHSPVYRRTADAYKPDSAALAALRGQAQPVRVRVYFGSWCPFCKQFVPHMLKVAEELAGSKVAIEFYGLPKPFTGEPAAEADKIGGVPTGVVWVGNREVGRIEGDGWRRPETALRQLLNGKAS